MRYTVTASTPENKQLLLQELADKLIDQDGGSLYNAHYDLTEQQATDLRTDPRVLGVEIHYLDNPYLRVDTCISQPGNYNRNYNNNASYRNWGLLRHTNRDSLWNYQVPGLDLVTDYNYLLDGSGVDVIIIDTGVQANHPEFALYDDGTGGSRVVDYDWAALADRAGITGVPTATQVNGYLGDPNGHGTQCASIAAGNRQGWAKKAAIYTLRALATGPAFDNPSGPSLGSIPVDKCVQLCRAFHNEKPIDPATGYKRPTIVNNSWAFSTTLSNSSGYNVISSITYQGTTYTNIPAAAIYYQPLGAVNANVPTRNIGVDMDIAAAVAVGCVFVSAANNWQYKIDVPGGSDYDNYITSSNGQQLYYHRGSTPGSSPGSICVSALGASVNGGVEVKAEFSSAGPRTDIWAAGVYVFGAYKLKNSISPNIRSSTDTRSGLLGSNFYLLKLDGTSQATPQVAGVCALLAQQDPRRTPADILNLIVSSSTPNKLTQSGSLLNTQDPGFSTFTNYRNLSALFGAPNRLLYIQPASPYAGYKGLVNGTGSISGPGSVS